jgi:xylan 1,4-beta-xylosidase
MKRTTISYFSTIGLLLGISITVTNLIAQDQTPPRSSRVEFTSFSYQGNDPVCDANPPAKDEYSNPILTGFYPDPSVCRVGDDFYLVNSSFSFFPGVPIFRSRNLVSWKQIGHVLDRPSQLDLDGLPVSSGIFAPAITHHDGVFYVITTNVHGIGNFFVTAKDPAGPWSDPMKITIDGIDPSIFFDDNGKAYIVHNGPPPDNKSGYEGHRAVWLWAFDPQSGEVADGRSIVNGGVDLAKKPVWIEGPHLFKRNGWYYLCCAEGGTGPDHSQVVFRTKSLADPFVPWSGNPILTQRDLDPNRPNAVTALGHADLVETPSGDWWAVFLGIRPYEGGKSNIGRETFLLPVTWENDWPVILEKGVALPRITKRPDLPAGDPSPPTAGSFTWKDDFDSEKLGLHWLFLRTPRETWWSLSDRPGSILIAPRPVGLTSVSKRDHKANGNPSFIARRQQHVNFKASTRIAIRSHEGDSEAGLAALQNDTNYFFLSLAYSGGKAQEIFLERHAGYDGKREVIAKAQVPPSVKAVELQIEGEGKDYRFLWRANDQQEWRILKDQVDGSILSTQDAGGFVGTLIGMHVRTSSTETTASAGSAPPSVGDNPSLRTVFKGKFLIGTALNDSIVSNPDSPEAILAKAQFNAVTAENVMKWEAIHPTPEQYDFAPADRFVDFGTGNDMVVFGHTLVWHNQTPEWVFKDSKGAPLDRDALLARMRDHIHTVVGRYKGRVKGWDVVNEALDEDGSLRQSPWLKIIGEDYITKAFQFAHEADSAAELYYNDYGIEGGPKKDGALVLLKNLKTAGVPITGVGIQNHVTLTWPEIKTLDETIAALGGLELKVMITELDVDVLPSRSKSVSADVSRSEDADPTLDPFTKEFPAEQQQLLARRYAELFGVYLKHQNIVSRVTFWGVTDRDTWRNDYPIKGRTNHPLPFDRSCRPKPAFDAIIGTVENRQESAN